MFTMYISNFCRQFLDNCYHLSVSQEREFSPVFGWEQYSLTPWLLVNTETTNGRDPMQIYQVVGRYGQTDTCQVQIIQKLVDISPPPIPTAAPMITGVLDTAGLFVNGKITPHTIDLFEFLPHIIFFSLVVNQQPWDHKVFFCFACCYCNNYLKKIS